MKPITRAFNVTQETWQLKKPFIIARGSRTATKTITVHITENGFTGRGEAVASPRYGETDESVIKELHHVSYAIEQGICREELHSLLPASSARNAIDNALWDLEAKLSKTDIGISSQLGWPTSVSTVQTISILTPNEMHKEAKLLKKFPVIKVKLNADHIIERVKAVHQGAPKAKIIIDANESWDINILKSVSDQLEKYGVVMIEQPLKAGDDAHLIDYTGLLPIFADESCHIVKDLPTLKGLYKGINIKLDKTGGLTEGLKLFKAAQDMKFDIMVGCMLGTSLGMAPALFIAQHAKYVDVDAPALLAADHNFGLTIKNGVVSELDQRLWGA
jgi:L-alanine-DL-glutamate epimerase-like enolase superfamily enzyme